MSSRFELDIELRDGSGITFTGVAGETVSDRDAVRIGANGRIYRTDADDANYMPCIGIAMAAASTGNSIPVLLQGFIELPGNVWTPGARLYVTTAPGAISHSAPAGSGDIVQEVGVAYDTTQIYFNPQMQQAALP